MYTIALIRVQHLQHSGNNYSYMILKPPAPALQVSVNPDYLTARTKLGTQEFRGNKTKIKLQVSHGTGMSKTVKNSLNK